MVKIKAKSGFAQDGDCTAGASKARAKVEVAKTWRTVAHRSPLVAKLSADV